MADRNGGEGGCGAGDHRLSTRSGAGSTLSGAWGTADVWGGGRTGEDTSPANRYKFTVDCLFHPTATRFQNRLRFYFLGFQHLFP